MLKRKGRGSERQPSEDAGQPVDEEAVGASELPPAPPAPDRSDGPFDAADVESTEGYEDFGALLVRPVPGLGLRLETEPATRRLVALTMVLGSSAVQVRVLAAPRSGGQWQSQRESIATQLAASGGSASEVEGRYGPELIAQVPGKQGETAVLQPMRFVGVEGPRWLLYASFLGDAAGAGDAGAIEQVFRDLVVVRGEEAMPVGSLMYLHQPQLPDQAAGEEAEDQGPTVDPLEPGARITETR